MIRPNEHDYIAAVAYSRALEYYCNQLEQQADHLKTVMIAAAEEISKHWDAHCDEEGYGPVNLLRRLESGIPAQYGYSAGDFQRLQERAMWGPPDPLPECKTEAEKTAFAFGWFKSLEAQRLPQRPWVGLTKADVDRLSGSDKYGDLIKAVVTAVESELKRRNDVTFVP